MEKPKYGQYNFCITPGRGAIACKSTATIFGSLNSIDDESPPEELSDDEALRARHPSSLAKRLWGAIAPTAHNVATPTRHFSLMLNEFWIYPSPANLRSYRLMIYDRHMSEEACFALKEEEISSIQQINQKV
uniref:Uncharacterized protein n=1 Tax=Romanomermis culicivorax TaxID=13658 RepID=A0A915JEC9_ROMCU